MARLEGSRAYGFGAVIGGHVALRTFGVVFEVAGLTMVAVFIDKECSVEAERLLCQSE